MAEVTQATPTPETVERLTPVKSGWLPLQLDQYGKMEVAGGAKSDLKITRTKTEALEKAAVLREVGFPFVAAIEVYRTERKRFTVSSGKTEDPSEE